MITNAQMSLIEKLTGSKQETWNEIAKTLQARIGGDCGPSKAKKYATKEDASETIKRLQSK